MQDAQGMLKFRIQDTLLRPLLVAGMIVIGTGFGLSQPSEPPEKHEHTQKSDQKPASNNPLKNFWNWTTADAVSFYTFVLAIFTGVLSVIAIVQIRYLVRADKTARISADAANLSANAAVAANLPIIRPQAFSLIEVTSTHARPAIQPDNVPSRMRGGQLSRFETSGRPPLR
jgi:hypothetical protein